MPKYFAQDTALDAARITVAVRPLPDGWRGMAWNMAGRKVIVITPAVDASPIIRYCTIAHEYCHLRRGSAERPHADSESDRLNAARDEARVRRDTARLLMPDAPLLTALRQGMDPRQLAHEFDVIPDVVTDRLELCRTELDRLMRGAG